MPNVLNVSSSNPSRFLQRFPSLRLKGLPQLLCSVLPEIPTLLQQRRSIRQQATTVQKHLRVANPGALISSGASTGRPSGSATRKHKCLLSGARTFVSHESEEPRRSNTPGSFLRKRSRHPRQSLLVGDGGHRWASSRPAALSVSEGAIGIPLLFCA